MRLDHGHIGNVKNEFKSIWVSKLQDLLQLQFIKINYNLVQVYVYVFRYV